MDLEGTGIVLVGDAMNKTANDNHPLSKQKSHDDLKLTTGTQPHPIRFSLLVQAFEANFIVGGALEKVATACASSFVAWKDPDDMDEKEKELRRLLTDLGIDNEYYFLSLLVTGNAFAEIMLDLAGRPYIAPFLIEEMYVKLARVTAEEAEQTEEGTVGGLVLSYVQSVGGKEYPFTQAEVIQRKTVSLSNRYYGISKFAKASKQIQLLEQIDNYYVNLFDKGLISPSLLIDKSKTLTDKQKEAIKNIINDSLRGLENSYKTAIIPAELVKLDLTKDEDTKAFLEYRDKLIRNIALALNVPYDLLDAISSNRSSSEVALEQLSRDVVLPLQVRYVSILKRALREYFGDLVDGIQLKAPDTKNQLEEMKVHTGYIKAGVLEANEVRTELGKEEHEEGYGLNVDNTKDPALEEIEKTLEKTLYTKEILHKIHSRNV
jgi:HK97 family phage portal protein